MSSMIFAVILFIAILAAIAVFFGKLGKLSFWKLASKLPEEAFEHFSTDPTWVVGANTSPGNGFVGPFRFYIPSLSQAVKLYARDDGLEASQQKFMERYASDVPRHSFPYLSMLALLYPIAAMVSIAGMGAPTVFALGYGFANLGYLLGVGAAFLIPGHFRILGLDSRIPTLVAGVIFWVVGFVLSNFVPVA